MQCAAILALSPKDFGSHPHPPLPLPNPHVWTTLPPGSPAANAAHHRWVPIGRQQPLALRDMPDFTVMGMTACHDVPAPAGVCAPRGQ